jgi:hypothetical protein
MGTTNESSDGTRIRTYFAIWIGVVGTILPVFGLVFSGYGFISGISLAFFGLVMIIVIVIFYVVSTDGADKEVGVFSGPKFP